MRPKNTKRVRVRGTASHPCPECGARSRVTRTTLGERRVDAEHDHVLRERVCASGHRFRTEEHPK